MPDFISILRKISYKLLKSGRCRQVFLSFGPVGGDTCSDVDTKTKTTHT